MYNNFNGYRPQYNNNGGYNRYRRDGGYNAGQYGSYNQNNRPRKKKSGAKAGVDKNRKPYVRGWNASRRFGLRVFYCSPYKNTGQHDSRTGRTWENWMCRIQQQGAKEIIVSCLYDTTTRKVTIPEMSIVINPSTNYCGTNQKRRN